MPSKKAPEAAATPPREPIVDPVRRSLYGRGIKRKVSLTIDESLLEDIRALAGDRPVSAVVNDLLGRAVAQHRLSELVDEMIAEAGEPPPESYEYVLSQWFGDEGE